MSFFNKFKKKEQEQKVKEVIDKQEENIVTKVKQMYQKSYDAKASLHSKWKKNYKAYNGELFDNQTPSFRSNEVSNYVFSTIETIKPIMLNDNPKTNVVPKDNNMYDKARVVQCILDNEWKRAKMFKKLHLINHMNLIYGTAILGIFWNSNDQNKLGNVEPIVISPFNFYPEPSATDLDKSEYCIYATYKKVSELCKMFPDKSEEIKAQATSNVDENLMFGKEGSDFGDNNVLCLECYMKDYSVNTYIEEEINDEGIKCKYEVKERKYPNGRRVIIAGDVLLEDGQNPYNDNGDFPFVVLRCYPQYGTFWGISEVEMLISPQEHANRIMNGIIENALLNGNPWTIIDNNSGVEKNSLSNRPGLVIRKNPGSEVKRDAPPPLPSYVQEIVNVLKNDMQEISGVFDVVKGERPGSVTAASAIQALNEQAQGRIRLKVQFMEDFISEVGGLWIKRVQQFWITQRTIRVAGKPIVSDLASKPILLENGTSMQFITVSRDEVDGDYDFDVFAGSTMQTNKSAIAQTVIQLAQTPAEDGLPMLDRQTVLENVIDTVTNINIKEVLDRFNARTQQQAEGQAQSDQILQETQQMKMQHEIELEQMREQHEMGLKNMEHASKLTVQRSKDKADLQKEILQKQVEGSQNGEEQENNGNKEGKTLQNNKKEVQYKEDGKGGDNLQEIIEYLLSLPADEYEKVLKENPQLAQIVQAVIENGGQE